MTEKLREGLQISSCPELYFAVRLARRIREAVMPVYGIKQYDVPINQISHDFNYALDEKAEGVIERIFQRTWKKQVLYGYATEDQGLKLPSEGDLEWSFLIDPVDGSRPANIGAENACVNIAIVRGDIEEPTLGDVEMGVVLALKEGLMFVARKGEGVYQVKPALKKDGELIEVKTKQNITDNLRDSSVAYETYSMSQEFMGVVGDPLLSEVSFKTENPAGSYQALTLVRGQNELDIDLRRRLVLDFSYLKTMTKAGGKTLSPMDIAPEFLMLQELGMVVTDGYGHSLDTIKLWEFNPDGSWLTANQISWVAAATPNLHQKALEKIEEGFTKLTEKYPTL